MKSKTEEKLDKEFERIGVKPWIYHFVGNVYPYRAITVAMGNKGIIVPFDWENILALIKSAIDYVAVYEHNRTTKFIKYLEKENVYVAVCDIKDEFSRKLGRVIAKGRLLKHLREI